MVSCVIIHESLDNLRSFTEGKYDLRRLKEVEDAETTALKEDLKIELSSSDAVYDALMALVYPEFQREKAND